NSEKSSFVKASANFLFVFAAGIYGGYFGAGLGVILMAVLSLMLSESMIRINALKQITSLFINLTAAIYFAFSPLVEWWFVLTMMIGAILGGNLGGMTAGKINASVLRWIIVIAGITISIYYFFE
ncbi:MAG: sulfite exporter TauE/SafE family protein, partial [Bacteroidota bacterium]